MVPSALTSWQTQVPCPPLLFDRLTRSSRAVFITFNATVGALALGFASTFNSAGKTILVGFQAEGLSCALPACVEARCQDVQPATIVHADAVAPVVLDFAGDEHGAARGRTICWVPGQQELHHAGPALDLLLVAVQVRACLCRRGKGAGCNQRGHASVSWPCALLWPWYRYAWEALVINELSGLFLYFTAPNVKITVAVKGETFLQVGRSSGDDRVHIVLHGLGRRKERKSACSSLWYLLLPSDRGRVSPILLLLASAGSRMPGARIRFVCTCGSLALPSSLRAPSAALLADHRCRFIHVDDRYRGVGGALRDMRRLPGGHRVVEARQATRGTLSCVPPPTCCD